MYFSLTVPNPLARLTRIVVAVEQMRAGLDPLAYDPNEIPVLPTVAPEENPSAGGLALDRLSLTQIDSAAGPHYDALTFLSLSGDDRSHSDGHDALKDLSLTREFPPRTGL